MVHYRTAYVRGTNEKNSRERKDANWGGYEKKKRALNKAALSLSLSLLSNARAEWARIHVRLPYNQDN